MGLLSWFFPSDEDKLARAKKDLESGRYSDARLAALELELPEAAEIVAFAEAALARTNLEHAVSWAEAGDPERVQSHLELAAEFRKEGMEADFADARDRIRAIEAGRQQAAAKVAEEEARVLAEISPGFADGLEGDIPLPTNVSPDEAEALQARLAILRDGYPDHLRDGMVPLGAEFAQAVLDLEDGRAQEALLALVALPDDEPLVLHERARAAHALGDPRAAGKAWERFAKVAGGHQQMGNHHTAALLAQVQAQAGDPESGLNTLLEARKDDPEIGTGLLAGLLEVTNRLEQAETVYRGMLQKFGKAPAIYVGIARVRVKGGHRMEAMQALETSLAQRECVPGRCGYRPPDLDTNRMLATLYLEDGIETERALELAEVARGLVQRPIWDDMYLAALAAKKTGAAAAIQMTEQLLAATPEGDPRRELLTTHLVAA
jgi:tetratricopeptide (TPR) repeat protein